MMISDKHRLVKHLYLRAGFGLPLKEWEKVKNRKPKTLVPSILSNSKEIKNFEIFADSPNSISDFMNMTRQEKKSLMMMNRKKLKKLNSTWLEQMAHSKAQLREKMALFWHDHFACRVNNSILTQKQINTIRTHAIGKFGDLLHAISKDPAMLRFLNNQQNKKAHPNENFAREVLELFSLGQGNYSENDIKEAARAFTGWSSNREGEFIFRKRQHDFGKKEFLGKKGNFDGNDILNIILEQRQTARFLTEKIYRYLVNPELDERVVDKWAKGFYESEYDISQLLETIFTSDHFYESQNIGARIKSPIEYLAGIMRTLNLRFEAEEASIRVQKLLGQTLFQPPNVSGWPDGKEWIDSSSMMARMKIPQALIFSSELNVKTKSSFSGNEDGIVVKNKFAKKLGANINWSEMMRIFNKKDNDEIIDFTRTYFLQVDSPIANNSVMKNFVWGKTQEEKIKTLCMRMLSTPEYQLC